MTEKKFAPSNIKTFDTKYGEFTTIGFPVKDMINFLQENEDKGWVNLALKSTKEGKKYLELNSKKEAKNDNDFEDKGTEDEIPFS